MRRVRLSRLLLGLLAVLALVAAGCGGGDDEGGSSGSKESNTTPAKGKQGGKLTYLAAADVDYIDPGQTYYTFGYQVLYATNRPLYSFAPEDEDKPRADLADGDPQISEDNKTITVKIKTGDQVRAAGQPRGEGGGRQVRVRARVQRERALRLRRLVLQRHRRRAGRADQGRQADLEGIETPDDYDDRLQAQAADGGHGRRGARDADHRPGAEGVRGEVRREVADRLRPVRRLHRPVHGPQRRRRQARRARSRQADRARPQPELGQGHGLPSRLPRRDHDRGGQRRPDGGLAPHAPGPGPDVLRLRRSRRSRSSSGR